MITCIFNVELMPILLVKVVSAFIVYNDIVELNTYIIMAEIVNTKKGFKVIKLTPKEAVETCGFGFNNELICGSCNKLIQNEEYIYYVPVLNEVYCEECYDSWYARAIYYKEDCRYEDIHFYEYADLLNLNI